MISVPTRLWTAVRSGASVLVALVPLASSAYGIQADEPAFRSPADERQTPTSYQRTTPRAEVRVQGTAGNETLDVTATRAQLSRVLRQVALQSHRELVGIEFLSRDPEVTIKLRGADLRDALRWTGGSVGLRIKLTTSQIRVDEDVAPYPTQNELYDRASGGYFRALVEHPGSAFAPGAMWNRARIEASIPGRALEAARAFDAIPEKHPESDLLANALLQAGIHFGKAHAWEEATTRFDQLAGLPRKHEHSLTARRLLADAHTRVAEAAKNPVVRKENAQRALYVIEGLEDADPTQDREKRRNRYIVRSRAYSLVDKPVDAIKCVDLAESYSLDGERDPELARIRALAFTRAGRHADAARAWLFHGSLVDPAERKHSYVQAATAANEGGEYVSTIAIAKAAAAEGFEDAVAPFADAAWTALDMEPQRIDLFGDSERLVRGERLFEKGLHAEAARSLRPVFDRRTALTSDERLRLARTFSKALAKSSEMEQCATVLRKAAAEAERAHERRELYLLASDLLERAGMIDRAIQALEGRL